MAVDRRVMSDDVHMRRHCCSDLSVLGHRVVAVDGDRTRLAVRGFETSVGVYSGARRCFLVMSGYGDHKRHRLSMAKMRGIW